MGKLNQITSILSMGSCAAFMYAGGTNPNRLRIVNGLDDGCFYDIEDNHPKSFKEERISNVFAADPALLELFEMARKGSNFLAAALEHYNKTHKELVVENGYLKVATRLYAKSNVLKGIDLSIEDKRLDLWCEGDVLVAQNWVDYDNPVETKVRDISTLINILQEFADG